MWVIIQKVWEVLVKMDIKRSGNIFIEINRMGNNSDEN